MDFIALKYKLFKWIDKGVTCLLVIALLLMSARLSFAEEAVPPAAPPEVSAETAVVIELHSGKVLYEKNAYDQVYPASTTKILTAFLAIEDGSMDEVVKVPENAAGVEGSSIYLAAGEELPMADLVYGLMLRSGNDAAVSIAELVAGSTDEFMEMMNARAKEIGAEDTNFITPNGLHDENHYTTAYDMAIIAREAMMNETFREVVDAKSYEAHREDGKFNFFYNKNKVVYEYEGGTGIKIGYTTAAGRTLVASSERNGMELICVVMGAPDWFNDTYKLMDYIYDGYESVQILSGDEPLLAIPVSDGEKTHVYAGTSRDVFCPMERESEETDISVQYLMDKKVNAPVERWQQVGVVRVYSGDEFLFEEPLYYLEDIDRK